MISKKTIKAMAASLHMDATRLNAALEDKENDIDVDIPEVTVFTSTELSTRDSSKYNEGKEAGEETAVKEYKKVNNLDFKGKKVEDLVKATQVKTDQTETINALRKNIGDLEKERDSAKETAGKVMLQSKVHAAIPDVNNGMSKTEIEAVMIANGFEFKDEGGKVSAYRNGEKIKDSKLQTDVEYTSAIKDFVTEKKWVGEADDSRRGRGGDNSQTKAKPSFTKASEVQKAFEDIHGAGSSMGTEKGYTAHLQKIMKEAEDAGTPLILD